MGKGTIVSGGTGGYYSISLQLDATAIAARIVDLQARLVDLQSKITDAESTLDDLEDDLKKVLNEQDALIDAFAADSTADNLKALTEKAKEVAAAAAQVGLQRSAVAALVVEEASVRKEITRLSAAPSSVAADAWCADYTEDLTGDVGVVTVPGGEREQHLQILPGYEGGAVYNATRDGMLRQPYTDSAAATYYNLAMLPGWQKWIPRYRLAQINSIDAEENTCSLTIASAISGQQGLGVNYATAYSDVPIEYMNCNAQAFAVGDAVLVEFVAQTETGVEGNWAAGKLKVVGFASNPKACGTSTWLCWPSSDGAVFGWGDPYENPPGTPVNPPLGTVQTSYSDAAHIARGIGLGAAVTHGENKIAAMRDWRDSATPLVVSWDSGSIYSGGSEIVAGTGIMAACVRWSGGVPYLLWLIENPDVIYSAECTIVDDVVTEVIGSVSSVTVSGGMTDAWWCEFSQNGALLVLNLGSDITTNASYYANVPWPFAGQVVNPVFSEKAKDPVTSWIGYQNYEGTQEFLIKSQIINNQVKNVWLEVRIKYFVSNEGFLDDPITGGDGCNAFVCRWDLCGKKVYSFNSEHPSGANHAITEYFINMRVFVDTTDLYADFVQDTLIDQWSWTVNAADSGYGDIAFPPSSFGPFPGWCPYPPNYYYSNKSDVFFRCMSRQGVDARNGAMALIDFGKGNTFRSAENEYWLRVETHREAGSEISKEITGNYGYLRWPRYNTSVNEAKLLSNLLECAETFCPPDDKSIPSVDSTLGMSSVCLSDERTVACAWGLDQDDGVEYYVDLLEGADIDTMLSIENQDNQRIIIRSADRFFGLLKQS